MQYGFDQGVLQWRPLHFVLVLWWKESVGICWAAQQTLLFGLGSAWCFAQGLSTFALYLHCWPQHLPHSSPGSDYISRLKAVLLTLSLLWAHCVLAQSFATTLLPCSRSQLLERFEKLRSHLSPRNEAGVWCLFCFSMFGQFSCTACPTGQHLS